MSPDYLIDCGNSFSKLSIAVLPLSVEVLADDQWQTWCADKDLKHKHCVIMPGNRQRAERVRDLLADQGAQCTFFQLDPDSVNCDAYPGMGLDRFCAGVAGIQHAMGDVVVLDAGTMLTVSLWLQDHASDFSMRFAGGFIAPGAQTCLSAMHHAAPALPALEFDAQSFSLGHDTESHMQAAISLGWPAMAKELLAHALEQNPKAAVLITGGAASILQDLGAENLPDLSLRGMYFILNKQE